MKLLIEFYNQFGILGVFFLIVTISYIFAMITDGGSDIDDWFKKDE